MIELVSNELQIIAGGTHCDCVDSKKEMSNIMLESAASDPQACARYCCNSCEARIFLYDGFPVLCTNAAVETKNDVWWTTLFPPPPIF